MIKLKLNIINLKVKLKNIESTNFNKINIDVPRRLNMHKIISI